MQPCEKAVPRQTLQKVGSYEAVKQKRFDLRDGHPRKQCRFVFCFAQTTEPNQTEDDAGGPNG